MYRRFDLANRWIHHFILKMSGNENIYKNYWPWLMPESAPEPLFVLQKISLFNVASVFIEKIFLQFEVYGD